MQRARRSRHVLDIPPECATAAAVLAILATASGFALGLWLWGTWARAAMLAWAGPALLYVWAAALLGWRGGSRDPLGPSHGPLPEPGSRAAATVGVLWGTAVGDALGLAAEGMSAAAIRRRFGRMDRPRLLCGRGFVSDDTEQAALLAQSLVASADLEPCARRFRSALLGWALRGPFGIGLGTLRACLRMAIGLRCSGVGSAGNGAAMRAGVLGVVFQDDPAERRGWGRAIAEITHREERAVAGALFVAEMAAGCARAAAEMERALLLQQALATVEEPALRRALRRAWDLARAGTSVEEGARVLGTSGFVLESVPFAAFCFARATDQPALEAVVDAAGAGGDTDTTAAIVGAWVGARYGPAVFPPTLIATLDDGPFGPTHLRRLGEALAGPRPAEPPSYSATVALLRNLALYPVVLGHALRRLLPF